MIDPNFFLGYPVPFGKICNVYPPKVKDLLNNKDFPVYKKLLLSSQEDIEDEWADLKLPMEEIPTPLQYAFIMAANEPKIKEILKQGFEFFIHEPVTLLMDQCIILIGDLENSVKDITSIDQLRFIKEDNFFDFQNMLRRAVGEKEADVYNPEENPRVKYFKAKARYRDKIKAKSKDALNLGSSLAAICCMNFGINPLNIGELSQCAIPVLMRYYQEKNKYEIDIQALLAGADSKKVKPQNWIRNIED